MIIIAEGVTDSPFAPTFLGAGQASYSAGTLAVQSFDSGFKQGVLTNRGGTLNVVANGYENIPGQSFPYVQFLDPGVHLDRIAFIGWGPNGSGPGDTGCYRGIFESPIDGALATVVDTNTASPATATPSLDFARGPAVHGETMLFMPSVYTIASLDSVCVRYKGEVLRVIDTTQTLDGKTPVSFDLHQDALSSETSGAFLATFDDGSKGIYIFTIDAGGAPCTSDIAADGKGTDGVVNLFDLLALLANSNTDGPGADIARIPPTWSISSICSNSLRNGGPANDELKRRASFLMEWLRP